MAAHRPAIWELIGETIAPRPGKMILSTVGAHVGQFNLLNNSRKTEEDLRNVHAS